jgi:hypothetical protein
MGIAIETTAAALGGRTGLLQTLVNVCLMAR